MTGFVYFIKPVGMAGPIKIGFSQSPIRRLRELAAWSPFELEIAALIPGTMALELNIQDCLKDAHSHREWFRPTEKVMALVAALKGGVAIERAIDLHDRKGSTAADRVASRRPADPSDRKTTEPTFVDMFVAEHGSQFAAAKVIGVSQVAVCKMVRQGRFTPRAAIAVDGATSGRLPCWKTRPDLWDAPSQPQAITL